MKCHIYCMIFLKLIRKCWKIQLLKFISIQRVRARDVVFGCHLNKSIHHLVKKQSGTILNIPTLYINFE